MERLELRKGMTLPGPELSSRLDLVLNTRATGEPDLLSQIPRFFSAFTEIIQLSPKWSPYQVGPGLQKCDSLHMPLVFLLLEGDSCYSVHGQMSRVTSMSCCVVPVATSAQGAEVHQPHPEFIDRGPVGVCGSQARQPLRALAACV